MQKIGKYEIDIFNDQKFSEESFSDLQKYDLVYFDESEYLLPTVLGVKVFENEELLASALIGSIGGGTVSDANSIIIETDRVLLFCSDTIFCLTIPELRLSWKTKADPATCLEILKYQESYIVHGELTITRIDKDGDILWQQSGADIFVTPTGSSNIELTEDLIIVTDFENRKYLFGYDGKDQTVMTQFR